jgi:hypothetical protein
MRDEPDVELRCQTIRSSRSLKRCWCIQTAGRWSWKSKPAKECEQEQQYELSTHSRVPSVLVDIYYRLKALVWLVPRQWQPTSKTSPIAGTIRRQGHATKSTTLVTSRADGLLTLGGDSNNACHLDQESIRNWLLHTHIPLMVYGAWCSQLTD